MRSSYFCSSSNSNSKLELGMANFCVSTSTKVVVDVYYEVSRPIQFDGDDFVELANSIFVKLQKSSDKTLRLLGVGCR